MRELPRLPDGRIDLSSALEDVRAAAERIRPYVRETPSVYSYTFSEGAGAEVFLKLENLQRTGSFKIRGALNKLLGLDDAARHCGLVAASAGNHAQGVALAARMTGCRVTVVMPEGTALIKVRRTEEYGADVVLAGETWDEAQERALELAREHGWTAIHPFDDYDVLTGQGTVGLEILEQVVELETLVVPVGGGGLIAGIALAVKALAPRVRVVGVQALGASPMVRSLHAGRLEHEPFPLTIADGIRVGRPGELTFEVARELLDDCLTVDEDQITDAVVQALQKSKILAEPAGAVGIAALASGRLRESGRTCTVVSGGNIDLTLLGRLIESGLARGGFYHLVQLRLPDRPGQLRRVLAVLARTRSNILDVQHYRAGWKVPLGSVDVEILLETRHAGQGAEIDGRLRAKGFEPRAQPDVMGG